MKFTRQKLIKIEIPPREKAETEIALSSQSQHSSKTTMTALREKRFVRVGADYGWLVQIKYTKTT